MIPRGLRINKSATSLQTPDLKKQWEDILSECSIKLMKLLIEDENHQLILIQEEINKLEVTVKTQLVFSEWEKWQNTVSDNLKKMEENIIMTKQSKFERDLHDYSNNEVYSWKKEHS